MGAIPYRVRGCRAQNVILVAYDIYDTVLFASSSKSTPNSRESLKQMLNAAVSEAAKSQKKDGHRTSTLKPELIDDKQVISEFFTKIAQKYN